MKTLIIVGSAPCVIDDLREISPYRKNAWYLGVNEGVGATHCDYLATMHPEHIPHYLKVSINKSLKGIYCLAQQERMTRDHADLVTTWLTGPGNATSAGFALSVGQAMGFDEMILCGCPLTGGDGYHQKSPIIDDYRVGDRDPESALIHGYQKAMKTIADSDLGEHVYSMSGYTNRIFGNPSTAIQRIFTNVRG